MSGLLLSTMAVAQPVSTTQSAATAASDEHEQRDALPVVVAPVPISTPVTYPAGATGNHVVVVELTISAHGVVDKVLVVEGEPPFSDSVVSAAKTWRFEPAKHNGVASAARVRFTANLSEPVDVVSPSAGTVARANSASKPAPGGEDSAREGVPNANVQEEFVEIEGKQRLTTVTLSQAEIRELPGAFGDPFRALELLPGVTPIASGLPYYYVRGAPPGNVGYFFDGIGVPALFHFALGPAVLHPAFIERVDLFAGAYPARYGRFSGGIAAGEAARPRYERRAEFSVRLVDSGAMAEVPFSDGRGSVMAGGRFSYTGALLSLIVPDLTLAYWDYQLLTRYKVDARDEVEVLAFGSGDLLKQVLMGRERTVADITFHRLDLRWDRQLKESAWRHALTLGYDKTQLSENEVQMTALIAGARTERRSKPWRGARLRLGADVRFDVNSQSFEEERSEPVSIGSDSEPTVDPTQGAPIQDPSAPVAEGSSAPMPMTPTLMDSAPMLPADQVQAGRGYERVPGPGEEGFELGFSDRVDSVWGAYAELALDVTQDVEVTPGLRVDVYTSGSDAALGIDPRLAARYRLNPNLTLVHAVGLAHQPPSFPVPVPGSNPTLYGGLQRALQYSAGAEWSFAGYSATGTLFHNVFFNLTDPIGSPDPLSNGLRSLGRGYGVELMLRREWSRLRGFIAYTLSSSERSAGSDSGPARFDRLHVLNATASYDLGRNWRFGNRLMFYTGIPAEARLDQDLAGIEPTSGPRARTLPFYRLDWRLQKRWPNPADGTYWALVFEVLNTTLNTEEIALTCYSNGCEGQDIGPVTLPSIGVEASF